jgi:drug/metabolite transporter (DMT)-like permease
LLGRAATGMLSALTSSRRGHIALFAGLLAVSTSGPFFVMSRLDAYAAVFWRTLLAGALGLAIAAVRRTLDWRAVYEHRRGLAVSGVLFGTHFLFWIKAFDLTDYASNLLLLVSQPLVAALVGARIGEALSRHAVGALGLSALGMLLIAGGDFRMGPRALLGDALCITAGALIALLYVLGRRARNALPLEVFMGVTMLVAAAVALPVALWAGVPIWGFGAASWAWLGAIVVVTTLMGHGLLNMAARYVPLFTLNLVIVLEPVVAIAMGSVLFGARVTPLQCAGGTLLGAAVLLGMRGSTVPDGALSARAAAVARKM